MGSGPGSSLGEMCIQSDTPLSFIGTKAPPWCKMVTSDLAQAPELQTN